MNIGVRDSTEFIEFGKIIKARSISVSIVFNKHTNNYIVRLVSEENKKDVTGQDGDIVQAFNNALYEIEKDFFIDDEPTKPDIRIDTKYRLVRDKSLDEKAK